MKRNGTLNEHRRDDKPAAARRNALKAKLQGRGASASTATGLVTTAMTHAEIVAALVAWLRERPKQT